MSKIEDLHILSPIHRASRQIGLYLEEKLKDLGLPNNEAHVVSYLHKYPSRLTVVQRVFGMKQSTLTCLIDRLVARGLVQREPDPKDRRATIMSLTKEGKRVARVIRKEVEILEEAVLEELDDADRKGFRHTMDAIQKATGVQVR